MCLSSCFMLRFTSVHVYMLGFMFYHVYVLSFYMRTNGFALALGALHAWGFEVWLLKGYGPNLCFPKAFEQSARFPWQKFGDMSPYFHGRN